MIGRGDRDGVEVFVLQRFADVLHTGRFVAALLAHLLPARLKQAAVGVDQIGDLHAFETEVLIDVRVPLSVDARDADTDHVVRPEYSAGGLGPADGDKWKGGPRGRHAFEEAATRDFLHGCTP
jgi:hypothetical protein